MTSPINSPYFYCSMSASPPSTTQNMDVPAHPLSDHNSGNQTKISIFYSLNHRPDRVVSSQGGNNGTLFLHYRREINPRWQISHRVVMWGSMMLTQITYIIIIDIDPIRCQCLDLSTQICDFLVVKHFIKSKLFTILDFFIWSGWSQYTTPLKQNNGRGIFIFFSFTSSISQLRLIRALHEDCGIVYHRMMSWMLYFRWFCFINIVYRIQMSYTLCLIDLPFEIRTRLGGLMGLELGLSQLTRIRAPKPTNPFLFKVLCW